MTAAKKTPQKITQKQLIEPAISVADQIGMDADSLIESFHYHLACTLAKDEYTASEHDRYFSMALAVRDRLISRWIRTQQTYHDQNVKRVCYLSLEFLIGRIMVNNAINLGIDGTCREAMARIGLDWEKLYAMEVDAALGNGGLGRLAACFLDSMATLKIPGIGYGIRYNYGVFKQRIENGHQIEKPDNWLSKGNPWEVPHPMVSFMVPFGGRVEEKTVGGTKRYEWIDTRPVIGTAYDTPIVGYGAYNVNYLRLWSARAADEFHFEEFSRGDYVDAVEAKIEAENLTKVLYPNDNVYAGRELRLRQQYFFVSCSIQDIVRRFKVDNSDWMAFPEKVFVQMNDTHPALVVPELMRILIDDQNLDWKTAWDITTESTGYTNHTLLPEALEKWPVSMFEKLLPRHLQIIYDINARFLRRVSTLYPGNSGKLERMSIIQESPEKAVRMANLAIVGSSSTNGVAELHSKLLKEGLFKEFDEVFPDRLNNKTNGVTPRRWLLKANPGLSSAITEKIGDGWITDLDQLRGLEKFENDKKFLRQLRNIKDANKTDLAAIIRQTAGVVVHPDSMYQVQVKRIHEYKRQLLLCLYVVDLYRRIKHRKRPSMVPQTFIFGGKAAPAYTMAKLVIKLINNVADVINNDHTINDKIKVAFIPDYRVSLAEKIIPGADVSIQISTAGMEASGTGNMKFAMNGALTLGTLDGANIEIKEEVGDDNIFIFGHTAHEVESLRPQYNPREYYEKYDDIRATIDLIAENFFSLEEPGIFQPIIDSLLNGDFYLTLADFHGFIEAQKRVEKAYRNQEEWSRMALLNIARTGRFSSDRTIAEYAKEIWNVEPVEIPANK